MRRPNSADYYDDFVHSVEVDKQDDDALLIELFALASLLGVGKKVTEEETDGQKD